MSKPVLMIGGPQHGKVIHVASKNGKLVGKSVLFFDQGKEYAYTYRLFVFREHCFDLAVWGDAPDDGEIVRLIKANEASFIKTPFETHLKGPLRALLLQPPISAYVGLQNAL